MVHEVQKHYVINGRYKFLVKCVGFRPDWKITTQSLLDTARDKLLRYLNSVAISLQEVIAGEATSKPPTLYIGPSSASTPTHFTRALGKGAAREKASAARAAFELSELSRLAELADAQKRIDAAGAELIANIPDTVYPKTPFFTNNSALYYSTKERRLILLSVFLDKKFGAVPPFTTRMALFRSAIMWNYFMDEAAVVRLERSASAKELLLTRTATNLKSLLNSDTRSGQCVDVMQRAFDKGQPIGAPEHQPEGNLWRRDYEALIECLMKKRPDLLLDIRRLNVRVGIGGGLPPQRLVTFASLSSGMGGFDKAAELAGISNGVATRVIASIDMDSTRSDLHEIFRCTNNARLTVARIEDVFACEAVVDALRGRVNGILASPLCTPFSTLGNQEGWAAAESNFTAHFRASQLLEVNFLLVENTKELLTLHNGKDMKALLFCANHHGFFLAFKKIFNAIHCKGAPPHSRERLGLIFVRKQFAGALKAKKFLKHEEELFTLPGRGSNARLASHILEGEDKVHKDDWVLNGYRIEGDMANVNYPVIPKGQMTSLPSTFWSTRGWSKGGDFSPTLTGNDGSSPLVLARRKGQPHALRHYTSTEALSFGSWELGQRQLPSHIKSSLVREVVGNSLIPEWAEVLISLAIKACCL